MFTRRQLGLLLVVAALGGGAWLFARKPQDVPPKSESQAAIYSICHLNNDIIMLDALRGKTWMLRKVGDGTPAWLTIPRIDSDKEAAQLLEKSVDGTEKVGTNKGSLSIDKILKERGYIEIPLKRLRAGYLCVDLHLEGKKVFLAVDTAAPMTCLDSQRVNHLQLKWQSWNKEEGKEKPNPKMGGDRYCEISKLEIGGSTVGDLMIWSHDMSDINKALKFYSEPLLDGVLGSDTLTRLNAIIDCSAFKLYIRSRQSQKE